MHWNPVSVPLLVHMSMCVRNVRAYNRPGNPACVLENLGDLANYEKHLQHLDDIENAKSPDSCHKLRRLKAALHICVCSSN